MKVKEVVKLLKQFDQEANIYMQINYEAPYTPKKEFFLAHAGTMMQPDCLEECGVKKSDVLILGHHFGDWKRTHPTIKAEGMKQ